MKCIEIVADFGDLNGEGPVWDGKTSALYWTDCIGCKFYCYSVDSGEAVIAKDNLEVTGYALNDFGGFVTANSKGIWLWDGNDEFTLLADTVDGQPCQMNDGAADPAGRFLAGSYFYDPDREYRLGCLFQVDTKGAVRILDDGIKLANGIGFSPDQTQLYFTDSAERVIYRYDYNVANGDARNRTVLIRVPLDQGVPDGLSVDAEGFLWSAQWYGGCIVRYDPDGRVERRIQTPAKQTSSLAFGGSDLSDIYITSAAQHFPSPLMPTNYRPENGFIGGPLYRLRGMVAGKPQFRATVKLHGRASCTDSL